MKYLLIGGAGFIGINFAKRILENKDNVIIFDKFLRKGTKENVEWLLSKYPNVEVVEGDIRYDTELLLEKINDVEVVHHLAAQVAVTTSVANPREDFEHNALGTLNVCEAIRESKNKPILIYASTNKVYG
ncbi:MAG TPA: NAD-dependent dehydratase, partial [Ignavibacteriales bacterium]|nr:NAD-dependent dehydratase [Ignavibacteriales bacterium]